MPINTLLSPDAIMPLVKATSARSVTATLAKKASSLCGIGSSEISEAIQCQMPDALQHVSMGVAILHITLPTQKAWHAVFARLATPIEFTATSHEPFDLILLLITGKTKRNEHLQILAEISRLFRDRSLCNKLRGSTTPDAMYALLTAHPD